MCCYNLKVLDAIRQLYCAGISGSDNYGLFEIESVIAQVRRSRQKAFTREKRFHRITCRGLGSVGSPPVPHHWRWTGLENWQQGGRGVRVLKHHGKKPSPPHNSDGWPTISHRRLGETCPRHMILHPEQMPGNMTYSTHTMLSINAKIFCCKASVRFLMLGQTRWWCSKWVYVWFWKTNLRERKFWFC